MPTLLEVMQSRIGIQENPSKGAHNPVIVGWFKAVGHPEIHDDETSWCSVCCGSAAADAGLPIPPVNVNMMARSWLTWGVSVPINDIRPGDVAVWPRGNSSWQGHVNVVESVGDGKVVCVGGNQGGMKGGDAVTRSKPRPIGEALGFRRAVPATVKDLREAGSTTIKQADNKEKLGIIAVFTAPIAKGIEYIVSLFGPEEMVPKFASLPEGLTWWQSVLGGVNAVANYALAHPWLAATVFAGLALWGLSRIEKRGRVQEHAAGIPIAAEVAKLQGA
jgi:uncharacterized protein (TIGR02594 family)